MRTEVTIEEHLRQCERLAADWFAAWKAADAAKMAALVTVPFYCDNGVLTSKDAARKRFAGNNPARDIQLSGILSKTVAEAKTEGLGPGDRVMSNMRVTDDDFVVILKIGDEGIILFFRAAASGVEFFGMWD